jgi:Outer membrane protein beta-barrel domain
MRLMSRAALSVAAVLFAAPALHAQASFSIAGGATVPMGSTADGLKTGYNITAGVGIKPPLAPLGLRVEGMLNQMDFKTSAFGSTRLLAGIANVTLSGVSMPMGYLIGGVGMYNVATPDIAGSTSKTKAGFNVGAGLNFPLTGFSTFAEVRFHLVTTDNQSMKFVPITVGIKF